MTTTPRRLKPEERRAWLACVQFSTHLSDHLDRRLRRDAGMTHADYTLLVHLSSVRDHSLTMSELAERLTITRSRLARAVTPLRGTGCPDRRQDPGNRRHQFAVLTEEGMRLLERAAPAVWRRSAGPSPTP